MRTLRCTAWFALLLAASLVQSSGDTRTINSTDKERISTEFSAISLGDPISETLWIRSGQEEIPLRIHNRKRSIEVPYTGPNPISFFRREETGEGVIWTEVASLKIDTSMERPLVFLLPRGNEYRATAIEDSFSRYPTGGYRFYNLTDSELVGRVGEKIVTMPSRETAVLENVSISSKEIPVQFVIREPDRVSPIYSAKWKHYDRYRYLIFISPSRNSDTGPIQFRILSDAP